MNRILKYLILLSMVLFLSCNKDKAKLKITDFSKSQTVVLKPYKWKPYTLINIEVNGYVNDTIKIKNKTVGYYDILLIGKVDTLIKIEYYGGSKRTFIFEPYKATKGELEIEIKL